MSAWLTPLPEGGSGADSFSVSPVIPALLVRVAPRAQAITPARSRLRLRFPLYLALHLLHWEWPCATVFPARTGILANCPPLNQLMERGTGMRFSALP